MQTLSPSRGSPRSAGIALVPMLGIDWSFWMEEDYVRIAPPFWDVPAPLYLWMPRICILLGGAAIFTFTLAFFVWRWTKWRGSPPVTFE